MSDDVVSKLREKPFRRAFETEDQAKIRRQAEREVGANAIEHLRIENAKLREQLDRAETEIVSTGLALNGLREVNEGLTQHLGVAKNALEEIVRIRDASYGVKNLNAGVAARRALERLDPQSTPSEETT